MAAAVSGITAKANQISRCCSVFLSSVQVWPGRETCACVNIPAEYQIMLNGLDLCGSEPPIHTSLYTGAGVVYGGGGHDGWYSLYIRAEVHSFPASSLHRKVHRGSPPSISLRRWEIKRLTKLHYLQGDDGSCCLPDPDLWPPCEGERKNQNRIPQCGFTRYHMTPRTRRVRKGSLQPDFCPLRLGCRAG